MQQLDQYPGAIARGLCRTFSTQVLVQLNTSLTQQMARWISKPISLLFIVATELPKRLFHGSLLVINAIWSEE